MSDDLNIYQEEKKAEMQEELAPVNTEEVEEIPSKFSDRTPKKGAFIAGCIFWAIFTGIIAYLLGTLLTVEGLEVLGWILSSILFLGIAAIACIVSIITLSIASRSSQKGIRIAARVLLTIMIVIVIALICWVIVSNVI